VPAVGHCVAQVPEHADTVPPLVLIASAWNVPDTHAVQTTSAVELPGVE
jgi:hypothetical protein